MRSWKNLHTFAVRELARDPRFLQQILENLPNHYFQRYLREKEVNDVEDDGNKLLSFISFGQFGRS